MEESALLSNKDELKEKPQGAGLPHPDVLP